MAVEPSQRAVEEWAEREKERRQAWLSGPTDEEKQEWIRRERHRREVGTGDGLGAHPGQDELEFERYLTHRLRRDTYLAGVGVFDLVASLPERALARLIRSGLEAQNDFLSDSAYRRRLPPDHYPED